MKRMAIFILIVVVIPAFGFVVGQSIEVYYEKQWSEALVEKYGARGTEIVESGQATLKTVCADPETSRGISKGCESFKNVILLKNVSIWTGGAGLALFLIIFISARAASANRNLLVSFFAPGIKIVLFSLFVLIIVQGGIATYASYLAEVMLIGRVHFILIGSIGLGAFMGAAMMISRGLSISKRVKVDVLGKTLSQSEQPKLYELVENIAEKIGAITPNNVVVGLEPTFYVTSADVSLVQENISYKDETLYLSLPLMRILSKDELAAVVGHELGHFKGEDTKFSIKFYPIYVGTSQALEGLTEMEGGSNAGMLALYPAMVTLSFFISEFANAERKIGRQREFEADKAGVLASSAKDLATALLKIGALTPAWKNVQESMIEDLQEGRSCQNASKLFSEVASSAAAPELLDDISEFQISHPTDTHPTTIARLDALDVDLSELKKDALMIDPQTSSIIILDNVEQLEEELTEEMSALLNLNIDRLLATYNELVRTQPENPEAHYHLGLMCFKYGRFEESLLALKEAVRLQPDTADIHYVLGLVYLEMGDQEGVVREHEILKELDQEKAQILFTEISNGEGATDNREL